MIGQGTCLERICGPVEQVDDTTFTVRFYRMGMYNPRRTSDIWLLASHPGDKHYKGAVQQVNLRIPYRLTEGKRQHILFPGLEDVKAGSASLPLIAVSDCGLPVYYYVKEGPAQHHGEQYAGVYSDSATESFPGESDGCGLAVWIEGKGTDSRTGGA